MVYFITVKRKGGEKFIIKFKETMIQINNIQKIYQVEIQINKIFDQRQIIFVIKVQFYVLKKLI